MLLFEWNIVITSFFMIFLKMRSSCGFRFFSRSRSRSRGLTLDLLVLATTSDSDSELPLPSHSYSGSLSLSKTPRSNCSSLECVSIKVWKMFVRVSVQPSYLASQKWNLGLWVRGTIPPKVKELHQGNSAWTKIRSYTNVRNETTPSKHRTCAPDMLFTQTIKSQNVAKPHSSGEETLWHNRRTCPDSGLHCGIGSHCLTDSCRKNEEEEEEEEEETTHFWRI